MCSSDLGADREECVPKGSRVGFVPRVDAAEGEPEGDQEAARDDEGKHERDSGHQVLVRPGLFLGCRRLGGRLIRVSRLNRRLRERLTDQGLAGRDRRLRRRGEDPLADEAAAFHLLVRGDEDEGGPGYLLGRQGRSCADGPLGLACMSRSNSIR